MSNREQIFTMIIRCAKPGMRGRMWRLGYVIAALLTGNVRLAEAVRAVHVVGEAQP